jgi:hypothetical protein
MTPEQRSRFNGLLSEIINSVITGEPYERQLAREDHLRNYVDDLLGEDLKPLPILNRDEDSIVRSMAQRETWRRSAMSAWAQVAVASLEEKGLLIEDESDPDTVHITNAGRAYVEGRRLPNIVIPPYDE